MESTTEAVSVYREMTIAARPETVWQFLVDPDKAIRWMGKQVTLDPRPGGIYRVQVTNSHTARGEFVELDPPHRLVYTWGWEPRGDEPNLVPPGSTTVEVELVAQGDGTLVRFTHRDLPGPESAERHGHGWDHYLGRFVIAAAGGDPGPDPWLTGSVE